MATSISNVTFGNDLTSFKAYATAIRTAILGFGWTQQTGHGEVTWSQINAVQPLSANAVIPIPTTQRWQGTFTSSGATPSGYTGTNTDSSTNDVVVGSDGNAYMCGQNTQFTVTAVNSVSAGVSITYGGTFTAGGSNAFTNKHFTVAGFAASANNLVGAICLTSTTTTLVLSTAGTGTAQTATATATQTDDPSLSLYNNGTNGGLWYIYPFEVYVNASTTNPIYLKIIYSLAGTSGFPQFEMSIGSAYSTSGLSQGQIGGNQTTWGVNNVNRFGGNSVPANQVLECDFSGDAYTFRMIFMRSGLPVSAQIPFSLVIDYARDNQGNILDTYWMVAWTTGNVSAGTIAGHQFVYKPGAGGIVNVIIDRWTNVSTETSNSTAFNGTVCCMPLFNTSGYLANPMLGAMVFKLGEVLDGSIVNVVLFGASHSYLISKGAGAAQADPAIGASSISATNQGAIGILFE